jgi:hypothetical protein
MTAGSFAMVRRDEQRRSQLPVRRWLALGAVAALLIGAIGCGGEHAPREGGANTPKAKENRKIAEASVADAVKVAANQQVATHPDLRRKNGLARAEEKIIRWFGMERTVEVSTSASPPPPATPAASPPMPSVAPKPPAFAPQQTITRAPRGESPLRTAARDTSPVLISERVASEIPYPTEAEADMRALEDAQKLIEKKLRELDPPVDYRPPVPVIKNEYVRRDSRLVRLPSDEEKETLVKNGYDPNRKYVEYTVELTTDQVRELRTRNRVADALRGLGVIAAISLAGFLFLRLDEWSKGYLTSWLALAAAALGGGIVAAVVFV